MTVFVAGVHGVGKSYLCQQYACSFAVAHETASGLIRGEYAQAEWSLDKRVNDVAANQVALCNAVRRITASGVSLLLDGHFVLIDAQSNFSPISPSVFRDLKLAGIVLLEACPSLISSRLSVRDSSKSAVDLEMFIQLERSHAQATCAELGVPLHILYEPDFESFSKVVSVLFDSAKVG